jgi:HPt (histidine-containing phosphotransfer) domain-containing protein
MRASHVIKGAASNLMCGQLRTAAMNLEQAASAANDLDPSQGKEVMSIVQARYVELKRAVENFHAFLTSISV